MTTIDQIKQELRDIIELSDKATPGEWRNVSRVETSDIVANDEICGGVYVAFAWGGMDSEHGEANAALIAASRSLTPKMARALLTNIDWLEKDLAHDALITRQRAFVRLETIRREWEGQA